MISALEDKKQFSIEYRLIIDDRVQHTRLSARKSRDGIHLIIGVENIDEEVKKENKDETDGSKEENTEDNGNDKKEGEVHETTGEHLKSDH